MHQNNNKCHVYLWNKLVGTLVLVGSKIYFRYDETFNMEISPLELKISKEQKCVDLDFQYGLPGVFADSLPDGFGMEIIEDYFSEYAPNMTPNVIDKLLFIGEVSLGALTYKPAYQVTHANNIPIELNDIKQHKKNILAKKGYSSVRELIDMYQSFSPSGGARQKMIINYNPKNENFSIGSTQKDEVALILKNDESIKKDDGRAGIIEYIYSQAAIKSGINMTKCYLFKDEDGYSHFATQRFDIDNKGERMHAHTLAGLLNVDKAKRIDYLDFMRISNTELDVPVEDIKEIYRRMVFNYIYNNHDDHLKNHSFLMDKKGNWQLSPAYDLTYNDKIGHRAMKLTINGKKSTNLSINDFKAVAMKYGIVEYMDIINKVKDSYTNYKMLVNELIPKEYDYDIELYLQVKNI
ncbi:MAG: type II toxin-antitoxin system HipA family toxin [Campylobacterota bacterium]|nr:type II toxin-antitoxin system HipA family toxin [Campylobacterota bacterium]